MWFCVYMVNNAMVTWLPSLYKQHFGLSLQTSLGYGWITSGVGVIASIICALMIDKVGRRPWYSAAFFLAIIPLMSLSVLGAKSAMQVVILATLSYAICRPFHSLYTFTLQNFTQLAYVRWALVLVPLGYVLALRLDLLWSASWLVVTAFNMCLVCWPLWHSLVA